MNSSFRSKLLSNLGVVLILPLLALFALTAIALIRISHPPQTIASRPHKELNQSGIKYLIFWGGPKMVPDLIKTIGVTGDGRTRMLGFGLPCETFLQEKQIPQILHHAFTVALRNNIAVMLQFDFHVEWANRPDLWNWFDPTKPGYNPKNVQNVEWFGWSGPPAKVRYLNWGKAERMPPPMCFTSKIIRAEWVRLVDKVIAPPLLKQLARLKRKRKMRLFAGVLVGSEPTFDNYSHTDSATAKLVAADKSPNGQLGYRALLDSGYSKQHPPANIHKALGKIIQKTVAFWCKEFVQAGLPAQKLYTHIPAGAGIEMTSSPIEAAFNKWSRPGWSTYPVGPLQDKFKALYTELKKHGNPVWGGVEANAGAPGADVDWETYLGWHFNHGANLVGINIGATGKALPAQLEKSAFGTEAIAAYCKFLEGKHLVEKPISVNPNQQELRQKMDELQAGFRKWQSEGRDFSPIAAFVEKRMPALLKNNDVDGAIHLIDEALGRLKIPPVKGSAQHQ